MEPQDFKDLYQAGRVLRYHTVDVPAQSLASHSWGVAMVVMAICEPSPNLLKAALWHDLHEKETGDVPATAKWFHDNIKKAHDQAEWAFNLVHGIAPTLTEPEAMMLKWADTFELCLYCHHQARLGNEYAGGILTNGLNHIKSVLGFPTPKSNVLYESIFGAAV